MWLKHLEADRLRNLCAVRVELGSGLTAVVGGNGQGKTSLLEAVYLLSTGRSFRTRRLGEVVARQGGPLRVAGRVVGRSGETRLSAVVDGGERKLLVEEVEFDLEAYLGRLDVVALPNEHMRILRGGPDERRRFLDRGVVGQKPSFLRVLGEYRRALAQRNALLRRGEGAGWPEIDAWDERLAQAACRVLAARARYADELNARLPEVVGIALGRGDLRLRYRPSPERVEARKEAFLRALRERRRNDLDQGFTGVGPHRDEMVVELDGLDLRRYGSGGQVRAAVVALKLGKLTLLREGRGESPLFLMDEFDADLDDVRTGAVARFLQGGGFQAVVATPKEGLIESLDLPFQRIRMEGGTARTV